jgi:hypothetical protein
MDNHPIPQDVTGFQFRLIGQMTVKQFAYLAGGAVISIIFFYAPIFILIKIPLVLIPAATSLGLAFLPIEGRPMDVMAGNFLKALLAPNQFVFHKNGATLDFMEISPKAVVASQKYTQAQIQEAQQKQQLLNTYLATSKSSATPMDEKEQKYISALFGDTQQGAPPTAAPPPPQSPAPPPQAIPTPVAIQQPQPISQPEILTQTPVSPPAAPIASSSQPPAQEVSKEQKQENEEALEKQAVEIQHELELAKAKEKGLHSEEEGKLAHEKVIELDKKLQDILSEKQKLEQELIELKKQLGKDSEKPKAPAQAQDTQVTQNVRKIPQSMSSKVGMPTPPDVPNILMGIIKDPRGNVLPNILVEVRDQQQNPVRAFKTNQLGQFASATPLQKGVYTLAFEDPMQQHKFELVELTVDDKIIQPLEIISLDAREELRKQLFS